MKKLFIALLQMLKIFTFKTGNKVSEMIALKDQILLLQNDLQSKISKLDENYKKSLIKLAAADLNVTETTLTVESLKLVKEKAGRKSLKEEFMEAASLLEVAIPKQEMAIQKQAILKLHADNLNTSRIEFQSEADALNISLEQLQHEYEMHELNLEMGAMLYGSDTLSPTFLDIKNKVKDIKAKDIGTQQYNKITHQSTPEQLERKLNSTIIKVDYEEEFKLLSEGAYSESVYLKAK